MARPEMITTLQPLCSNFWPRISKSRTNFEIIMIASKTAEAMWKRIPMQPSHEQDSFRVSNFTENIYLKFYCTQLIYLYIYSIHYSYLFHILHFAILLSLIQYSKTVSS